MDSTEKKIDKDLMEANTWSHVHCEKLIQEMGYGNLTVTFRIHKGEVTDVLCQIFRRYRKDTMRKKDREAKKGGDKDGK